jgi:hypothetical protein
VDIKPSLYLWNKTKLIMVHDLFHVLLNFVCKHFIEKFVIMIIKEIAYNSLFYCCILVQLWTRWNTVFIERVL